MEEGRNSKPRLVLPCADDEGNFMCYICRRHLPSAKTLYNHLKSTSCYYRWRSVLPEKLADYSTVVVRHKLPTPDSSDMTVNEQGECSATFLPEWNAIGKMRTKRRRPHDDHTKAAPNLPLINNNSKVAEAVGLPEKVAAALGGGKVVLDVDLNDPVVMEMADDQ